MYNVQTLKILNCRMYIETKIFCKITFVETNKIWQVTSIKMTATLIFFLYRYL